MKTGGKKTKESEERGRGVKLCNKRSMVRAKEQKEDREESPPPPHSSPTGSRSLSLLSSHPPMPPPPISAVTPSADTYSACLITSFSPGAPRCPDLLVEGGGGFGDRRRGSFVMWWGREVGVRGQPLPSSILCLDSVLSAAPPRVGKHGSGGRGGGFSVWK